MLSPPVPDDESRRVRSLRDLAILDTPPEREFDDAAELAAAICGTPVALVSLVDDRRQWFKARVGFDRAETPREVAFCAHAIASTDLMVVPDARQDPRFVANPLVTGAPGIRFYAGAPLVAPDGNVLGTLCVIDRQPRQLSDVQSRALQVLGRHVSALIGLRALSRRLAVERARLAESQAVARVGSWETDLATMAVTWSDETHRIFGTDPDRFLVTHPRFLALVHPDDRDRVDAAFVASQGRHDTCSIEHRIVRPDGEERTVEERWDVFRDAGGEPVRAVGTCQDITERAHMQEALVEQAALLDHARDAILVRGPDHRVRYWNRSAERLYGWTADEAIGRPVVELLYGSTTDFGAAAEALGRTGEWMGELAQTTRDGQVLRVEAHWTLMRDQRGNPAAVLEINADVTERRRLEQQQLRGQRLESLGTLAGGIAHDLNNVLAPIMMSIELLREADDPAVRHDILATIEGSARHGADMVKQILSFARGVEGRRMSVQLRHVVHDIEKIANETFLKHIRVVTDVPRDLMTVTGDPTQLHQVLLNLCVNARDAMPHGGVLTIAGANTVLDDQYAALDPDARPGPYVVVSVEDTGTGMPPAVVDRIFEPFFTTKDPGQGTGLGLSTALAIVKSHGGFIRVASEPGQGTTFRIYLPAEAAAGAEPRPVQPPDLPRGRGELVLVVDDEAPVRQITRQTLEAFGYRVIEAADGAAAVALYAARKHEVALVLTDMMMPVLDGPATMHVLTNINPSVRIVAASGVDADIRIGDARAAGARRFLPKPFTAEELLTVIRDVLDA